MNNDIKLHEPVLVDKVLEYLAPKQGDRYLDLTAGYGGHASRMLSVTDSYDQAVLVDRDSNAIAELTSLKDRGAELMHLNFAAAANKLSADDRKFDIVLLDLGVSSPQLDRAERGFSFSKSGPIDMRMDQQQADSAEQLVNGSTKQDLVDIFVEFGEVKIGLARKVAQAIVDNRPFSTTDELADLIRRQVRVRQKTHPATKFFQALRVATNNELEELKDALALVPDLLAPGGRVGVISFHSLEDRIVKNYFKSESMKGLEARFKLITKKPICGEDYDDHNPRARSAKLRVAMRI